MLTYTDPPTSDLPQPQLVLSTGHHRDREVGQVKPRRQHDGSVVWHACLKVDDPREYLCAHTSLVQGHGATKEAAIRSAFMESRRRANFYLKKLGELETELLGPAGEDDDTLAPATPDGHDLDLEACSDTVTLL